MKHKYLCAIPLSQSRSFRPRQKVGLICWMLLPQTWKCHHLLPVHGGLIVFKDTINSMTSNWQMRVSSSLSWSLQLLQGSLPSLILLPCLHPYQHPTGLFIILFTNCKIHNTDINKRFQSKQLLLSFWFMVSWLNCLLCYTM